MEMEILTGILIGIVGSLIASVIFKAADNRVSSLLEAIKKKPYETFVFLGLCFLIVGMLKLAFLQG